MHDKGSIKNLKKLIKEIQEQNTVPEFNAENAFYTERANEYLGASTTFFLVTSLGLFVLLAVCWEQMAPTLDTDTDPRPYTIIVAVGSFIIFLYQYSSLRKRVKKLETERLQHRLKEIVNKRRYQIH
jgi:hypothetical protein